MTSGKFWVTRLNINPQITWQQRKHPKSSVVRENLQLFPISPSSKHKETSNAKKFFISVLLILANTRLIYCIC